MRSLICSALCGLLFAADLPAASFNNLLRTLGQEGFGTPEYDGALQEIARDHTKDPNFSRIYRSILDGAPSLLLEGLLRKVSIENPNVGVRLEAKAHLGRVIKEQGEFGFEMKHVKDKEEREVFEMIKGEDLFKKSTSGDPAKLIDEAERILKETIAEAEKTSGTSGAIRLAKRLLYEVQYLTEGKMAPETVGVDVNGKEFKLSDFKGKVVGMVFWGDW